MRKKVNLEDLPAGGINGGVDINAQQASDYFDACEQFVHQGNLRYNRTEGPGSNSIDMDECFTIYEFLKKLNAQIYEALLLNKDSARIIPAQLNGNDRFPPLVDANGLPLGVANPMPNLFQNQDTTIVNSHEPIAKFWVEMAADYTFSVCMNYAFAQNYYIKMSKPLFNMLQFKENVNPEKFERTSLLGRRFMGDRTINRINVLTLQDSVPAYIGEIRSITSTIPMPLGQQPLLGKPPSVGISTC